MKDTPDNNAGVTHDPQLIGHEARNLLFVIRGHLEKLLQDCALDPSARVSIATCLQASDGLQRLFAGRAGAGSLDLLQREVVPLRGLVGDVVAMLQGVLPEGVTLRWEAHGAMPHALVDRAAMERALLNVGLNGAQAMAGSGGVLRLSVSGCEMRSTGQGTPRDGPHATIAIVDGGRGMTEESRRRVFDRDFTTATAARGRGLGMWVSRRIVEAHGGTIRVESVPGQGTTVLVQLPCFRTALPPLNRPRAQARNDGSAGRGADGGGRHVLYVDDQVWLLGLVRELLEADGFRVTTHSSPSAALDLFRTAEHPFVAVIADDGMPEMSGLALLTAIHELASEVALFVTSALVTDKLETAVAYHGFHGVLSKQTLARDLTEALSRRHS